MCPADIVITVSSQKPPAVLLSSHRSAAEAEVSPSGGQKYAWPSSVFSCQMLVPLRHFLSYKAFAMQEAGWLSAAVWALNQWRCRERERVREQGRGACWAGLCIVCNLTLCIHTHRLQQEGWAVLGEGIWTEWKEVNSWSCVKLWHAVNASCSL